MADSAAARAERFGGQTVEPAPLASLPSRATTKRAGDDGSLNGPTAKKANSVSAATEDQAPVWDAVTATAPVSAEEDSAASAQAAAAAVGLAQASEPAAAAVGGGTALIANSGGPTGVLAAVALTSTLPELDGASAAAEPGEHPVPPPPTFPAVAPGQSSPLPSDAPDDDDDYPYPPAASALEFPTTALSAEVEAAQQQKTFGLP